MGEVPGKSSVPLPCCFLMVRPLLCWLSSGVPGMGLWTEQGQGAQECPGNMGRVAWGSVWGTHPRAGRASAVGPSLRCCVPPAPPPHASCRGLHRADLCLGGIHGGPLSAPPALESSVGSTLKSALAAAPQRLSCLSRFLTSPCRLLAVPTPPAVTSGRWPGWPWCPLRFCCQSWPPGSFWRNRASWARLRLFCPEASASMSQGPPPPPVPQGRPGS